MNSLRYWFHALFCLPTFRVRYGDGTLSPQMTYDAAQDYFDDEGSTAEEVVFDPENKLSNPQQPPPYEHG